MLLTTGQAAEELGCAVTTFRRLVRAGLLPGLSSRGVRVMVPLDVVQALSRRRHAPLDQLGASEFAVLRVDAAKPVQEPDRKWIGFAASLAPRTFSRRCAAGGGAMRRAWRPPGSCR